MERIDHNEPLRNKVSSAEAYFAAEEAAPPAGEDGGWYLIERRRDPYLTGALSFQSVAPGGLVAPHRLYLTTGEKDEEWPCDEANAASLAALFSRLAAALDAYYGFATDVRMPRQQAAELAAARARGDYAPQTPSVASDLHSVRDVYWLNYFGPAYVERWAERLTGLGLRQEPTDNGGVVIWATATPCTFQADIASFMDYRWKLAFYEALGKAAFATTAGAPWERQVPSREDHLRLIRRSVGRAATEPATGGPIGRTSPKPEKRVPAWLVQTAARLRRSGFFANTASDTSLAEELSVAYEAQWGQAPTPDDDHLDLRLASYDAGRVWWEDTEADVAPGNDAYVRAIQGWAAISRGALPVTRISEEWQDAAPLIRLHLGERPITLRARNLGDYLDMGLLAQLNQAIEGSSYRLRMYKPFDQTAFVVALSDQELAELEAGGWSFAEAGPGPLRPG